MLDWLAAPLSGATTHVIEAAVAWHARLMVLAWGVLLAAGSCHTSAWPLLWRAASAPACCAVWF